jgi:hypothetical protein
VVLVRRCIVVDTNALWDDLRLAGIAWQVLAAATRDNPACLRFCSTVLDEAKAKFAERANAEAKHLADETRKYLPDSALLEPVLETLKAEITGFEDYLADRIPEGLKAGILPYPDDLTHAEMTARALRRVPPFDQRGSGYRDSLIWLAALAEAESLKAELILVSNDSAFKNPEKGKGTELHPKLVAEAAGRGVNAHLSVTLTHLITSYLYPNAGEGVDLTALAASEAQEQIAAYLEEHLGDPGVTTSMAVQAMGLPTSATDFKISYVENVRDVALTKLQEIDGGQVVHSFTASCDVELDISVYDGVAEAFEWPIQERYGHGDVSALVHRSAKASGLMTLSPFGLAVAAEADEWNADPETADCVWDEECGCFTSPDTPRQPKVISVRLPASRKH